VLGDNNVIDLLSSASSQRPRPVYIVMESVKVSSITPSSSWNESILEQAVGEAPGYLL